MENTGQVGQDGVTSHWVQTEYRDQGYDIPFADWAEAQLILVPARPELQPQGSGLRADYVLADRRDRTRVEPQHERLRPSHRAFPPPRGVLQGASPGTGRRSAAPWRWTLALAGLLFLVGCVQRPEGVRPTSRGTGDITRAELDTEAFTSAYHAIERLRRSWLRRRGARTPNNPDPRPSVYMDGVRVGSIDELYRISPEVVEGISLLSATDATTRFGTGHVAGAILIVTRRGPPDQVSLTRRGVG